MFELELLTEFDKIYELMSVHDDDYINKQISLY